MHIFYIISIEYAVRIEGSWHSTGNSKQRDFQKQTRQQQQQTQPQPEQVRIRDFAFNSSHTHNMCAQLANEPRERKSAREWAFTPERHSNWARERQERHTACLRAHTQRAFLTVVVVVAVAVASATLLLLFSHCFTVIVAISIKFVNFVQILSVNDATTRSDVGSDVSSDVRSLAHSSGCLRCPLVFRAHFWRMSTTGRAREPSKAKQSNKNATRARTQSVEHEQSNTIVK